MYPRILGVYSYRKSEDIGTGLTQKSHQSVTYWFVRRLDDDRYELQPLNTNHVPSGIVTIVGSGEFAKCYFPETDYYNRYTVPALKTLKAKLDRGEECYSKGDLEQAEKEFLKAVMVDESNASANLGLGSVYCDKGDYNKVKKVLAVILNNDAAFREEQRHQFNSFGIGLRKGGLFTEAITYYQTALKGNPDDEHLLFNMARACLEAGDTQAASESIARALEINPDFTEAKKLQTFLAKKMAGENVDAKFLDGPDIPAGVAGPSLEPAS
ncbi:MAG: tetratricopeptide repeat protein [Desulfovibrionaceae bacterium]|nr:tetratricopeptide repeat protein [Desulfovibrionaceae bacterium]MBF0513337.1 tetratricopeptide repeat protein [Desulfovibrionaceae bacterium]